MEREGGGPSLKLRHGRGPQPGRRLGVVLPWVGSPLAEFSAPVFPARGTSIVGHFGHPAHGINPAIPAAVFLSGLLFLAAGVYLDRRPDVAPVYADVGFGAAVLAVLAAIALLLV